MTPEDYDRLTAITRESVIPKIIDQIGKDAPLLGRFLAKATRNAGTSLMAIVKYRQNSQGGYYAGLEILQAAQENTRTRVNLPWKQFQKPIALDNIELAKNKGKEGIVSLMSAEMADAKEGMEDQLATALFGDGTATNNKVMTGLAAAVDDGTNIATYAGVDRTVYTWWQANYTSVSAALTTAVMATMMDSCKHKAKTTDLIVTTDAQWSKYESLLQGQIRFINSNGSANKMDIGADTLAFRATPIITDPYCPAGKMFFLNMGTFKYEYMNHPKHPTDKKGFAMRPITEPTDQDGQVGYIFHYHQMMCTEPRANGQLDNLSE